MANDPDALFPSGPTTRRGLLSAFSRRAAEALPVPDALTPRPTSDPFDEELPDSIEPFLSGDDLIAEIRASVDETGMHVWWLGQSGFLVQIQGENLLIDPYLSDSLTEKFAGTETPYERITARVVAPELLSFVDVVLASNARLDHLDSGTLPHVLADDAAAIILDPGALGAHRQGIVVPQLAVEDRAVGEAMRHRRPPRTDPSASPGR